MNQDDIPDKVFDSILDEVREAIMYLTGSITLIMGDSSGNQADMSMPIVTSLLAVESLALMTLMAADADTGLTDERAMLAILEKAKGSVRASVKTARKEMKMMKLMDEGEAGTQPDPIDVVEEILSSLMKDGDK